jgi:hypothetical protein
MLANLIRSLRRKAETPDPAAHLPMFLEAGARAAQGDADGARELVQLTLSIKPDY